MNRKKRGLAVLALAAMFGLVLTLLIPIVKITMFGNKANAATDECKARPTYFALQARKGTNQFGPDQGYHDAPTAFKRLTYKSHCDPLFASTMVAFRTDGANLDPKKVEHDAGIYLTNAKAWKAATDHFLGDIKSYEVVNDGHTYQTLGMIPNGKGMPSLVRANRDVKAGWVLVLHFKDGTKRELRIICDLQPVTPKFPKVPPETPPSKNPPGGGNPPDKSHPRCKVVKLPSSQYKYTDASHCAYRKKDQHDDDMLNKSRAWQNAQNNDTSGVYVGRTKDRDGNVIPEPKQKPKNTSGSTPPPANDTGYDSGGTGSAPGGPSPSGPPEDSGQGGSGNNGDSGHP